MLYKISNLKDKEWNGKKFQEADLIDTNAEVFKVSAWAGEFADRVEIDTELEKNDKGYWKLKKVESPRKTAYSSFKEAQIEKVQDRKQEMIGKTMDRKEEGMKLMAAQRDAVMIMCEILKQTPFPTEDEIRRDIIAWRNWFLLDKDFNSPPPF